METIVKQIDDIEKDYNGIELGGELIRQGKVVAFPTETVYGLGANALDIGAVEEIFRVKGRPMDNPLIVHIASIDELYNLVTYVPDIAIDLIERYWPGPLTLVLPKSDVVPSQVTADLDTVAIRMPNDPVALAFIRESGVPIAAPSANTSGRPSPTSAGHVIEDLYGKIPLILDGGECRVGLESTVLDLLEARATILRPGGITKEMIEEIVGEVHVDERVLHPPKTGDKFRSPGMKYTHYAPKAPVIIVEGETADIPSRVKATAEEYILAGKRVAVLATEETRHEYEGGELIIFIMGRRACPSTIASNLFAALRQCDEDGIDLIIAEAIEETHEGLAIMNRMLRAAAFRVVDAD